MAKQHGQIEKKLRQAKKDFEKQHRQWKWNLDAYGRDDKIFVAITSFLHDN